MIPEPSRGSGLEIDTIITLAIDREEIKHILDYHHSSVLHCTALSSVRNLDSG